MKLYRKKLSGLEELEREKIRLRYQKLHLDQMHAEEQARKNGAAGDSGLMSTILGLAGSGSMLSGPAFDIGNQLVRRLVNRRRKRKMPMEGVAEMTRQKSTGRRIFDDVFWSYIVGKAVRISYDLVRDSLKHRKSHLRK